MNGKPAHDVAIYTYDPAAKTYRFYNVGVASSSGTPIGVTKDAITYSGSFNDGDKHVLTRTLNLWSSPQRYAWRAEYSLDGGTSLDADGLGDRDAHPITVNGHEAQSFLYSSFTKLLRITQV